MSGIGALLGIVLLVYEIVLIARVVVDWTAVLAPGPESGWRAAARRVTHAATEPVLAPVRRVVRPVRVGSVAIDLAFVIVFVAVIVLRQIVVAL